MRVWTRTAIVVALMCCGCASAPAREQPAAPASAPAQGGSGSTGLRDPAAVAEALQRAEGAYMDGRWGDAVVAATRVIEGAASPEDYYLAVKILGLASCHRKDTRPVSFAWSRLQAADREAVRTACSQHGLTISDEGVVTVSP